MWLTADSGRAAGMLLQKLPAEKVDEESWNRLTLLAATITDGELLELEQQELIHRLFHEEDVRLFERQPVAFHCTCSRERVADALRGMGHEEVRDIIQTEARWRPPANSATATTCSMRWMPSNCLPSCPSRRGAVPVIRPFPMWGMKFFGGASSVDEHSPK